jgi:hypothetical protein
MKKKLYKPRHKRRKPRAPAHRAPSAALLALLVLLTSPLRGHAVSRDAADQSQTSDTDQPGYDAGQSAYAAGRFIDALRIWRPLADRGDPRAAFGLGLLYDLGEGVGQDAAAAYVWYRRAAEAGLVIAEFNIAVMCDSGLGTARNPAEAAMWYASAAAHGNARAEYNLAQLYQDGEGVPRNLDMAEAWYAAAAAHGLSAAASKLAPLREARAAAAVPAAAGQNLTPAIPTGPPVTPVLGKGEEVMVELSWAAPAQPVPVEFFVQVLALDSAGTHVAYASYSKHSAILVPLLSSARYVWRVYTVATSIPDYVPSAWSDFSVRTPRESEASSGSAPQLLPENAPTSLSTRDQPPPKTDQLEEFRLTPKPKDSNVFDKFGKPTPKLVQAEAGIACPPRDTFENAQAWVHEQLKCERHPIPNDPWIEWAEYCPSGPLGYFVLKVKTGQQKIYLFEHIPPAVWEGFKAAPSAHKFYHSEIKGKRHWFRLASELKPSICHW